MKYDYIPIIERKPLKWPNNARVALILTINLEHWDMIKDKKNLLCWWTACTSRYAPR